MSIIIQNISKVVSPIGIQQYELRINMKSIAKFEHRREQGLAQCLRRAARAAEENDKLYGIKK